MSDIIHDQRKMRSGAGEGPVTGGHCAPILARENAQDTRGLRLSGGLFVTSHTWPGCFANRLPVLFHSRCSRRNAFSVAEPLRRHVRRSLKARATPSRCLEGQIQISRSSPFSGARTFPKHIACKLMDASERHLERLSLSGGFNANRHSERFIGSVQKSVGVYQHVRG